MSDQIETLCHNACQAMHRESERAHRQHSSPEACLILAAALDVLLVEGISFQEMRECLDRLKRLAAPGRVQ